MVRSTFCGATLLVVGFSAMVGEAEGRSCPPPDAPGNGSMRALIFAEDMDGVLKCLNGGTDIDQINENGHTALHDAACWGKRRFVSMLISRGANVHARDRYGNTPAEWVASYGGCQNDREILDLLDATASATTTTIGSSSSNLGNQERTPAATQQWLDYALDWQEPQGRLTAYHWYEPTGNCTGVYRHVLYGDVGPMTWSTYMSFREITHLTHVRVRGARSDVLGLYPVDVVQRGFDDRVMERTRGWGRLHPVPEIGSQRLQAAIEHLVQVCGGGRPEVLAGQDLF